VYFLSEEKKVDEGKRQFLKYGGAAVAVVGAAAVGYMAGQGGGAPAPTSTTATQTVTQQMTGTGGAAPTEGIEDFLTRVSGPYKGQTVRLVSESTASGIWLTQNIAPKFEELTGIKIEAELLGWDDVMRKALLDAQQKGGAYELYYCDEEEILASRFDNGYILDWYAFADQHKDLLWPGFDVADLIATKYWVYNGKLGGPPFEHFIRTIVYRSDLFNDPMEQQNFKAKYGWDLRPAQTYAEYRQIAEFFTRPDQDLYGHVAEPNSMSIPCDILTCGGAYGVQNYGMAVGRRSAEANGGRLNSQELKDWLTSYVDLLKYGPPGVENFTWDDEGASIAAGRIAQGWVFTENFSYIEDADKSPKSAGKIMVQYPVVEPKYYTYHCPTIYGDSGFWGIAASGQAKEAAFLWNQYATCAEVQTEQMKALKGLAPRASLLYNTTLPDELDAKYNTNVYATIKKATADGLLFGPFFPMAEEPVARDILWKHLVDAVAKKVTPSDSLNGAASEIDAKLKSLGFPDLKGY
jgi:multiple sugar transport system substrate-binding protein